MCIQAKMKFLGNNHLNGDKIENFIDLEELLPALALFITMA